VGTLLKSAVEQKKKADVGFCAWNRKSEQRGWKLNFE